MASVNLMNSGCLCMSNAMLLLDVYGCVDARGALLDRVWPSEFLHGFMCSDLRAGAWFNQYLLSGAK